MVSETGPDAVPFLRRTPNVGGAAHKPGMTNDITRDRDNGVYAHGGTRFGLRPRTDGNLTLPGEAFDEETLIDPDPSIGYAFQGATETDGGFDVHWSNCNYAATQHADGSVVFTYDGDVHREGAPAIIEADGTERWFIHDTEVADPRPRPYKEETVPGTRPPITRCTGAKWNPDVPVKDVAKALRADIEHARRTGLIPTNAKIQVTSKTIRGLGSIHVTISDLWAGTALSRPEDDNPIYRTKFTDEGTHIYGTAQDLVRQYDQWEQGSSKASSRRHIYSQIFLVEK